MRRSCQLPDLIRLLRLKWPSGEKDAGLLLGSSFRQVCSLVQMTCSDTHSNHSHVTVLWFHSQITSWFATGRRIDFLNPFIWRTHWAMHDIVVPNLFTLLFWEICEECAGGSLCMRIFSDSQVVYSRPNLGVLILIKHSFVLSRLLCMH